MRATRRWLKLASVLLVVLVVGCAALAGPDRYSTDPETARIQRLTDFCITYGAIRDAATNFIEVDTVRNDPVLSKDVILAYRDARNFIKPFCSPTFDPQSDAFSLEALNEQLKAIRLILLAKENAA